MRIPLTPHFTADEIKCRHCGVAPQHDSFVFFLQRLEQLRVECGFPFFVNSGYRCPKHPIEQRKVKARGGVILHPHTHGAVDIRASRKTAGKLVSLAIIMGFQGIGLRQTGPVSGRFVHLDMVKRNEEGCPIIWTYESEGPREIT